MLLLAFICVRVSVFCVCGSVWAWARICVRSTVSSISYTYDISNANNFLTIINREFYWH